MVNVPLHLWHRSDGGGGGGGGTSSSAAASSAGASSAAASSAATSWDGVGGAEASDAAGFLQCTCLEDASVAAASAAGVSGAAAAASAFCWHQRLCVRKDRSLFCALLQIWHTRASASVATWSVASAVGSMSGAALVGGSASGAGTASATSGLSEDALHLRMWDFKARMPSKVLVQPECWHLNPALSTSDGTWSLAASSVGPAIGSGCGICLQCGRCAVSSSLPLHV